MVSLLGPSKRGLCGEHARGMLGARWRCIRLYCVVIEHAGNGPDIWMVDREWNDRAVHKHLQEPLCEPRAQTKARHASGHA